MDTPDPREEIALVDRLEPLRPHSTYEMNGPEIRVTIARLEPGKGTPRNFRLDSDTPKTSAGGCYARIFASASSYHTGTQGNLFGSYGPDVSYGDLRDYQHGQRALQRIEKRVEAIYRTRGGAADAADSMGRWLEATGIRRVFLRPDKGRHTSWLSEGEWLQLTVGEFVNRVRANLYVVPQAQTAPVAEAA